MPSTPPAGPVAILGATGRVGRRVILELDHAWRGLARGSEPPRAVAASLGVDLSGVRWADRHDEGALAAVLTGCRAVVDLCAFSAEDVAPARAVLERVAPGCDRVLLASSLAAEGRTDAALDDYGAGKLDAEQAWRAAGLAVAALRIGQVVDPSDTAGREAAWLRSWQAAGAPPPLRGTGAQRLRLAPIAGVARVIVGLLDVPADALPSAALPVTSPMAHDGRALATALAEGAALPVDAIAFGGEHGAGLFGGGDELPDTRATAQAVGLDDDAWRALWPDTPAALRALGRAVASVDPQAGH